MPLIKNSSKGVFVTGTDTGVGKTYLSRLIVSELSSEGVRVGVFKPFLTGSLSDALILMKSAGISPTKKNLREVNPYFFKYPLAPAVACELEKRRINFSKVSRSFNNIRRKFEFTVVEGAGGLLVPVMNGKKFIIDFVKEFNLPVLIVARPGLGTINHTLLSIEALVSRGIKNIAVVINNYTGKSLAEKTNPPTIRELINLPVFVIRKNYSGKLPTEMKSWLLSKN